jgi:hypothetical protein
MLAIFCHSIMRLKSLEVRAATDPMLSSDPACRLNFFQAFEQHCIGRRFLAALRLAIAVQESRVGQCQMYSLLGGYPLVIVAAYIMHER